jgi:ankyrin repeat protein
VEAAFDGDFEELRNWIQKGYHIESVDGRKHTALSEAASQGHEDIVLFLLDAGANPNALSDTGRSPMWRAAFNGHIRVVKMLLEAGSDPQHKDTTSMENVFDVSKTDEIRQILVISTCL